METSQLIWLAIGLWFCSIVVARMADAAASRWSVASDLGWEPRGPAGERRVTPIELWAMRTSVLRLGLASSGVVVHSKLLGWRALTIGLLADLLFCVSVVMFLMWSWRFSSNGEIGTVQRWAFWWVAFASSIYLWHVVYFGSVGRIGYHLRYVATVVAWPVFLIYHRVIVGNDE